MLTIALKMDPQKTSFHLTFKNSIYSFQKMQAKKAQAKRSAISLTIS